MTMLGASTATAAETFVPAMVTRSIFVCRIQHTCPLLLT
jgi:hypothetical protein